TSRPKANRLQRMYACATGHKPTSIRADAEHALATNPRRALLPHTHTGKANRSKPVQRSGTWATCTERHRARKFAAWTKHKLEHGPRTTPTQKPLAPNARGNRRKDRVAGFASG